MPERRPDPSKIECSNLTKTFGGTVALDRVDVSIQRGRVHAVVGENGAGKSTLGKVLAGVHQPDAGTVSIDGAAVEIRSPHVALSHSITMVAQELSLLPARTVVENVYLGIESGRAGVLSRADDVTRFENLAAEHEILIDPLKRVDSLSVAEQQKVEILRALARDAQVIIMDEPTARLSSTEASALTASMRRLAERGVTIVFVSHFLDEVLDVADDVTIMRNGRVVRTGPASTETKPSLIEAMVGQSLASAFPKRSTVQENAETVLAVDGLGRDGVFEDVSFEIRAGEIVTLAGLVGSGRSEVARVVFGADRATVGSMHLDGSAYLPRSPHSAIRRGVAMIPESRRDQALFMRRTVGDNVTLAHLDSLTTAGVVRSDAEREHAERAASEVNLTGATIDSLMSELSGGNQQKSVFARWLLSRPRLLIADEPTRGVDVGAKRGIYDMIARLADEGMAMLVVSSELEEVLGLAHRILVMRTGRIVGELDAATAHSADVMQMAFGMENS